MIRNLRLEKLITRIQQITIKDKNTDKNKNKSISTH